MADMVSITIDALPPDVAQRLQQQAYDHGHSLQDEMRDILIRAVPPSPRKSGAALYDSIRRRFEGENGVDLELPPREPMREIPTFE